MTTSISLAPGWTIRCPEPGRERQLYRRGALIGVVHRADNGIVRAEVLRVINADTDDEHSLTTCEFEDLDSAQQWVETTVDLL